MLLRTRQTGFTLTELMIVVAIIGLIASIAYPTYQRYVQDARRADCAGTLLNAAAALERFKNNQASPTYAGAILGGAAGDTFPNQCPPEAGATPYYNIAIAGQGTSSFTLTATPVNTQVSDECGSLVLDQLGRKTIVGATGGKTWDECWR